ncbi:uncharacterized protein NPIL_453791 [Nephila pilipes]|uniref:Uncharacterized protein n=1 Tax=Nephila pilipes TaxID=299642 RepID=A0A8X6R2V0_NEPPI|nr:uncharacterized protein NPIL_453791 [Nephila pilipes]
MVNPVFSLESLALTKIAIHVYSDPDIKISQCRKRGSLEFLPQDDWEPFMQKKFSSLNLPLILEKKLNALMKPLSDEICQWKVEHFPILNYCVLEQSIEYVWNYYGTIDRIKTAESYIQCESNIIFLRFKMASVYWLEEEAKQLWEKMNENSRRRLSAFRVSRESYRWEYAVKDRITFLKSGALHWRNHPFSRPLLWYCQDNVILQGNLLQQISPQDRLNVFKTKMESHIPAQTNVFCLLKMSAEHLEDVMKKEPLNVFLGLCNWPLHRQFQKMTDRIFSLLTEKEFRQLVLVVICDKIAWDWMDWDYVELLNELWNRSPVHFKQYVESSEFFDILKMALNHDYKKPFRDRCQLKNIKKIEKSFYNISYG